MNYRKGSIVSIRQHGGCVEVTVTGETPGSFVIDNLCMWSIVECEGTNWVGLEVEYEDGLLRFLDGMKAVRLESPTSDVMSDLPCDRPSPHA